MADAALWLLVLVNTVGVLAALALGRAALRRIALDRVHLGELRAQLENDGLPPLALKRKQYVDLAGKALAAAPTRGSTLAVQAHAQHGEDLILWDFFGRKLDGFFLDIGAHDGVTLSNTYFFESIGWKGVCVEANPELAKRAAASRPGSRVVQAACGERSAAGTIAFHVGIGPAWADSRSCLEATQEAREELHQQEVHFETIDVPYTSVAAILGPGKGAIDFVSIDVEGAELQVLQGIDFDRCRPTVLVIEDNSRGTDPAVCQFLAQVGYRKVLTVAVNDFYVLVEEARAFRV